MSQFERQAIFPGAELHLIKDFMKQEGFRPSQWLLGTGLPESVLKSSDTLVSLSQFDIIYRNVFRLVRTPDVGLRFGGALNLSRWGMLALALICARSLGAALITANRFRTLVRSRFDLISVVQDDQIRVDVHERSDMPFPVSQEFGYEMLIASLHAQIGDLLAAPAVFNKVQLQYPAPDHYRAYSRHCGCPVEFSSQSSVIWLPRDLMERTLPLANPITEKQAIAICEREVARVTQVQAGDIGWLVRNEFAREDQPAPDLNTVASRLAMSPRTLRRKLQQADTSFRELYQQHQLQQALQGLASEQRSLNDIAGLCGFRDAASFREAFKRWTKMTPTEYRAQFRKPAQV